MLLVSLLPEMCMALTDIDFVCLDYPRTLREWGRRLEKNLSQEMIAQDYPALRERANYDAFRKKWQYLFVYAGAGFAKGYITCHMLTFIRQVSILLFKHKYDH